MEPSRVFDRHGALDGRVAVVTGGGTNLGKAAAAELARCGAAVVIAGRRAEVLEEAAARSASAARAWPADIRESGGAEAIVRDGARAPRSARRAAEQRGRAVLRPGRGHRRQGLAGGAAAQCRTGRVAMCKAAYELAMRAGRRGHDHQRDRLSSSRDAGDGAHRARRAPRSRRSRASWRPNGGRGRRSRGGGRARALRHRVAPQVPGGAVATGPRRPSRPAPRRASRSTAGSSRCSPRRSARRCRARSSRSTARSTTGPARGRRQSSRRDGEVPTEERRAGRRAPEPRLPSDARGRGVNGCTGAFQALGTGSTPVARSVRSCAVRRRRAARIHRPRGVAQSGSAPGWGPGGRRFKSCLPDYKSPANRRVASSHGGPRCSQGRQTGDKRRLSVQNRGWNWPGDSLSERPGTVDRRCRNCAP